MGGLASFGLGGPAAGAQNLGANLSTIEGLVRFYAKQDDLNITTDPQNLSVANLVYRRMVSPVYRRWPEVTRADAQITTVLGQESYTWPTTPAFQFPVQIEFCEASDPNHPRVLTPVSSMVEWAGWDSDNNGTPQVYMLLDEAAVLKLAVRPKPERTGDIIRILGSIGVDEFTNGSSKTVFVNATSDDALAKLIAAEIKRNKGDTGRADELEADARRGIPDHDSSPVPNRTNIRVPGF